MSLAENAPARDRARPPVKPGDPLLWEVMGISRLKGRPLLYSLAYALCGESFSVLV